METWRKKVQMSIIRGRVGCKNIAKLKEKRRNGVMGEEKVACFTERAERRDLETHEKQRQ